MADMTFGIQFVVTRDGEPITEVITVESAPINLHTKHEPSVVWSFQTRSMSSLVRDELTQIDALADVVPDARPVGLPTAPDAGFVKEKLGVPILKVVNRKLLALNEWLAARNAKQDSDNVG